VFIEKNNMFIKQNWIIQFILTVCLLFTVSCETCTQRPLERGKDEDSLRITTKSVKELGSIDKNNLVIEVDGNIEINRIKATSILAVLVIPENELIDTAISEFKKVNKQLNKDTHFVLLPDSQGAVYYHSELPRGKTGGISPKVFIQGGLQPAIYKAYLIVYTLSHGTYSSPEGEKFEIPDVDATTIPTISVQSATTDRGIDPTTNNRSLEIIATAAAANFNNMKGGFFFIEKKDPKISPENILAELIKQNKNLPSTNEFQENSDIGGIIHSFIDGIGGYKAKNNNELKVRDANNLFKKGATYQVYAYLVELVDEKTHYIVSKEDQQITIPQPHAELNLKEFKIAEMIKDLSGDPTHTPERNYNQIEFEAKVEIVKQDYTKDPKVGFILVKDAPLANNHLAVDHISNLLAIPAIDRFHKQPSHNNMLVYVQGNINSLDMGEQNYESSSELAPLDINANYYVYAWLQDKGGEIFVSNNNLMVSVPGADLTVTEFMAYRSARDFYIKHIENYISQGLAGENYGYVLVQDGAIFDKSFLVQILENEELKEIDPATGRPKGEPKNTLEHGPMKFLGSGILLPPGQPVTKIDNKLDTLFEMVPAGTDYSVYLCCFNKQFIFYKKAPATEIFQWNPKADPDSIYNINQIEETPGGQKKDYVVTWKKDPLTNKTVVAQIVEKVPSGTKVIKYKNGGSNRDLIFRILTTNTKSIPGGINALISSNHADTINKLFEDFISQMEKE
jgi:hypothetical protein